VNKQQETEKPRAVRIGALLGKAVTLEQNGTYNVKCRKTGNRKGMLFQWHVVFQSLRKEPGSKQNVSAM